MPSIGWIIPFKMNWYIIQFIVFGHGYFFSLNILRNINQYRTRTACTSNEIRFFDNSWQVVNILNKIVMLSNRHCNTLNIRFLERILTNQCTSYLPCNGHHRYRVHISSHNACYEICRTRARGSEAHAYFTGYARITIGCMSSALFMAYEIMINFREAINFIINWDYSTTWVAEHIGYAKAMQCF